ncbi:protein DMR6-LIKE OXYGENASE 2-like [Durio zibethinus]|uniref:Protein DMR6-LIKE OXYGENASE 2-like n=1 Tax=Durio zibethinus TaxID=66656 RepID=A0A6P6AC79_DURZI|nr:protein DMR6-LIKE OXYGENASE 2-like [Durio zibethinus]
MAATVPYVPQSLQASVNHPPTKITSVKALAELPGLASIPTFYISNFASPHDHQIIFSDPDEDAIPVIDFSLLTSNGLDERFEIIQQLRKVCQDWGFFMVINHGVPESLMKAIIDASKGFFELTEDEKQEFEAKHVLDPIRCGTSFNVSADKVLFWRNFLKVFVHPKFHSPSKPPSFSEIALEYSKRVREVARELVKGISEDRTLNLENGFQILVANFYPTCPQPELTIGVPLHTDHGLLTLLMQNEVGGLQVLHEGKWVTVDPIPNSFLVNVGDHIEILSNGKYKSLMHRALVNNKATRISIAVQHGPALDEVVSPASEFVDNESNPPAYRAIKYQDYVELQQSNTLDGKSFLENIRIY